AGEKGRRASASLFFALAWASSTRNRARSTDAFANAQCRRGIIRTFVVCVVPSSSLSRRFVRIGPYVLSNALVVAPMAGVTDRPFRQLCKRLSAGYAISEMVGADPRLRHTEKSRRRLDHRCEFPPIAV